MSLAKGLSVYMNGVSLGCALQSLDATATTDSIDSTTLCRTARTYVQGIKNGTASASGIWDYDSTNLDEIHDVFKAAYTAGTENVVTATLAALAVGVDAIMLNSVQSSYNIDVQNAALIMCTADFQATSGINYGKILFSGLVNNTSTNGTAVDGGATSSNGGLLQYHIQNPSQLAGSVKLQHTDDISGTPTWVDVTGGTLTFSASGNKFAAGYAEVSGTIEQYVRVICTATSGSITFQAAFARR